MSKKTLFFDDSVFHPTKNLENGEIPPETRRRVRKGVLIAHVSILVIPLLWYLVSSLFSKPRPQTIKVSIVSPSAMPTPSLPSLSKAKNNAARKPRRSPVRRKPIKRPAKTVAAKPKWRPRKASQIKVSGKVVGSSSRTSARRATVKTPTAAEIEARLKSSTSKVVKATSWRSPDAVSGGDIPSNYTKKLYSAIYALWRQPSKAELNGLCPTADISFTIDASGGISNMRISRKSGIPVMDASVGRLIRELRALPPPPKGRMSFTVSLEIVEQ